MTTQIIPPTARLLTDNEVVCAGDFSKWSDAPNQHWVCLPAKSRCAGLPVATVRIRSGQPAMMFARPVSA